MEDNEDAKILTWEDLQDAKNDLLKEIATLARTRRKYFWTKAAQGETDA